MNKTLIALLLLASPAAASQNGYFEAQRLESARQDKVNKPTPKPADEPKSPCADQHCKPRN